LFITEFNARKAALQIGKTLKSAIANAEHNEGLSVDQLVVKNAIVDGGPIMKRFRPRARGSASPIQKKTSHITIVLSDQA
jgi:large subunit ribosomal protein L22